MPQTTFNTTITTTATPIITPNARRRGFSLQNTGTQIVFIGFSASVTTSSFVARLAPDGFFGVNEHAGMWMGNIYGITTTGTSVISGAEWRE